MVYKTSRHSYFPKNTIPTDTSIWACAFEPNSNGDMLLIQKPIKGEIAHHTSKYEYTFAPYNKYNKIIKSKAVLAISRHYADTEEECKELFNSLIDEEIKYLQDRIDKYKNYYGKLNND